MRWKEAFIHTLREEPRDAEAPSHKLMLRAGFIKRLSAGIYTYLPLGLKSLQKVIQMVREEMNKEGATELLMPALHPSEIWKETGRYEALGEDKFSFKNRSGLEYVLGPTHEEIITHTVAESIKSYKELPIILYQIQGKFRDEARPRFGIIRSKEFLMKDAYSFDRDEEELDKSYKKMHSAYVNFFKRTGLDVIPVSADPGLMGGKVSHEFMVRTPYGEDKIVLCEKCGYQASLEVASSTGVPTEAGAEELPLEKISTPDISTIENLSKSLKVPAKSFLKAILYVADEEPVMICLRGDHEVNEAKVKRLLGVVKLELADSSLIEKLTGAPVGFSSPVALEGVKIVLDGALSGDVNWIAGGNEKDVHIKNVRLGRDFNCDVVGDVRYATAEDKCPECDAVTVIESAMELGHIFKLGTRYTKPLKAQYLDKNGRSQDILMGCYGIGVNRVLAAAVEQFNDDKGIVWPKSLAPYGVEIIILNEKSEDLSKTAEALEIDLEAKGIEVLVDDRAERAGVKFNDADLIGIPIQVVVSDRNFKEGKVEIKIRGTGEIRKADISRVSSEIVAIHQNLS